MRQINPVLMSQLKADYLAIKQIGSPLLQCQGMLVPRGFDHVRFFFKSFPRPLATNNDNVDLGYAGGLESHTAGVPKTSYSDSFTMLETESGVVTAFSEFVLANGGVIDCDYYDGRLDSFTRAYEVLDVAMTFEQPNMDSDGRSQAVTISGSMRYMYFGLFADIGTDGTINPSQRNIAGANTFLDNVQGVISATAAIAGAVGAAGSLVSGLLG